MREDWPELIGHASGLGLRVGMFTNALKLSDDAAVLAKSKGLESVAFSVDGPRQAHDAVRGKKGHFDILLGAMESAKKANLPFSIVSHVNQQNVRLFPELHDIVVETGAFAWQIQLGTDMGNMRENKNLLLRSFELPQLELMLSKLKKRNKIRIHVSDSIGYFGPNEKVIRSVGKRKTVWGGCKAGTHIIGIESNGNVKGCLSIMAGYNQQGADFVEGNIRETPLSEIWQNPAGFAYNRQWSSTDMGGFCATCKHVEKCRGGCRAKITASGDGHENPMCVYRVLKENEHKNMRVGTAAAAILAMALGGSVQGCEGDSADTDELFDTETDTESDTGVDMTADYSAPTYGDTDTETGEITADYSDPGFGDTDTDTETGEITADYSDPGFGDTDTDTDTDTGEITADYSDPGFGDTDTDTETGEITADYSDPGFGDTDTDTETETGEITADYSAPGFGAK